MLITNYLTRLYCGMVSRWTLSGGWTTKTGHTEHWETGPGVPEEELKELLADIRTRVYTLKSVVEEQSREIENTLDETGRVVESIDKTEHIEQQVMNFDDDGHPRDH